MKKVLRIVLFISIMASLTAGCTQNKSAPEPAENKAPEIKYVTPSNDRYKDGTYHGESEGKAPGLKVTVVVKDGKISGITVDSHNETKGYTDEAMEKIPLRMVEKNSVDVDAVTRVTETTDGIKRAVTKALKDAKIE